jgi:hypothetical protein
VEKKFAKQARLPRGAYAKSLEEVLEPYMKKAMKKRFGPKIFKSAFGGYYVLTDEKIPQEEMKKMYEEQQKEKENIK